MPIRIVTNRTEPSMGAQMILHIKEHHLERAKQVLAVNVQAGRFPATGFSTFIGKGGGPAPLSDRPLGKAAAPKGTTRRELSTIQAKYLPYPGRIYFVNPVTANLLAAVEMFLGIFASTAPKGSKGNKGFTASYSKSLTGLLNNKQADPAAIVAALNNPQSSIAGVVVAFVNVAPHASTIEIKKRVMYNAAVAVAGKYAPGITVTYDYIPSDQLGVKYGRGTGGPNPERAAATGRSYPVTYALPRVQFGVNAKEFGVSNVRFVTPGRKVSKARRKKYRAAGRGRG